MYAWKKSSHLSARKGKRSGNLKIFFLLNKHGPVRLGNRNLRI